MTRLLDHLFADYKKFYEFQELSGTVTKDLDTLDLDWSKVEDDQFILTSSEPAVYRREKEFYIRPDRKTESLEFRKRRLLIRMQSNPPYVLAYLRNLLDDLLLGNTHKVNLDVVNYHLEVLIEFRDLLSPTQHVQYYREISDLLERIVPLNLGISIANRRNLKLGFNIGGAVSEYQITNILTPKFEMQDLQTTISYGALVAKYDTTTIEMPPFTIADAQISKTYGGAFSYWQQTTILQKEVV